MEHGEAPTAGLKSPLLLEMPPDQVRVTVAQGLSSKKVVHDTLRAKIKLMASVQTDQSTLQPVDTGEMGYRDGSEHVEAAGMLNGEGKGPSCGTSWTCGGNHCARSCPKGNSQVFGSYFGLVAAKTTGGRPRASTVAGVGHRAAQRPTSVWEVKYEVKEDGGHGDVESVSEGWDICGLEKGMRLQCCQRWRGCPRRRRRLLAGFSPQLYCQVQGHGGGDQKTRPGRWTQRIGLGVTRSNRLEALQEEENEQ